MKILYVTHATDLSGANRSLVQMIKELRDNHNVQPFVVCPSFFVDERNSIYTECLKEGIPCMKHRITWFKRRKENRSLLHQIYFVIFNFLNIITIFWKMKGYKFNAVHSNSSVIDTGFWIAKVMRIPHIWHLREFGKRDFDLVCCLGEKYEKKIYSASDRLIAISDAVRNEFYSKIIEKKKIVRIYNGIIPPRSIYVSKHENNIIKFCVLGRIDVHKNQIEAIKACAMLKKEGVDNFELIIIGRSEDTYEAYLKDLIEKECLTRHVKLLGQRYDISELLSKMDVGLMLSKNEAFGRVTIEYMLHGLAVIASNTGANCELINNDVTGLIYPLGNIEELKNRMKLLIFNGNKLKRMAETGRKYAYSKFLSINNSNEVFNLYKNLLVK